MTELLAKSGEAVKAGPIGLAVILLLCIACYFLFKSMSKHLKRVRENFPTDLPPEPADPRQLPGERRADPPGSDERAEHDVQPDVTVPGVVERPGHRPDDPEAQ